MQQQYEEQLQERKRRLEQERLKQEEKERLQQEQERLQQEQERLQQELQIRKQEEERRREERARKQEEARILEQQERILKEERDREELEKTDEELARILQEELNDSTDLSPEAIGEQDRYSEEERMRIERERQEASDREFAYRLSGEEEEEPNVSDPFTILTRHLLNQQGLPSPTIPFTQPSFPTSLHQFMHPLVSGGPMPVMNTPFGSTLVLGRGNPIVLGQGGIEGPGGNPLSYESLMNLENVPTPAKNLEYFPQHTYQPGDNHSLNKSGQHKSCPICMEDFNVGDTIKTVPCLHSFHTACIDQWLSTHNTCPVCKTNVDS